MINAEEYKQGFSNKVKQNINSAYGIEPNSSDIQEIEAPPEAILLTEDNCSACDFAKTALSVDIEQGKIKVCDLADEECKQIGRSIDLKEVPAIVVEDERGQLTQCEIGKEGDNIAIQCPVIPKAGEEPPARPPRHGKLGVSCLGWRLKNVLMVEAKNQGANQEDILKINSLPECASESIGFAPVRGGREATDTKASSKRGEFMRECLRDKTKGDTQPNRMRNCSAEYRQLKEEGKIK